MSIKLKSIYWIRFLQSPYWSNLCICTLNMFTKIRRSTYSMSSAAQSFIGFFWGQLCFEFIVGPIVLRASRFRPPECSWRHLDLLLLLHPKILSLLAAAASPQRIHLWVCALCDNSRAAIVYSRSNHHLFHAAARASCCMFLDDAALRGGVRT